MARILMIAVLALALLPGCSRKADTAAQRKKVASLLLKEAPRPQHALNIEFGDAITLVGYDAQADTVEPGKPFKVTWYYKVTKSPGDGWKQFTHLADGAGKSRINLDSNGPLRRDWEPSLWEAGSYVTDPQTITLPDDWKSDRLVIYAGFWKGGDRLAVKGPSDGEKRARLLELPVAGGAPEALAELSSVHAASKIKLDGKLDEAVWAEATATSELVNTMNGSAAEPRVTVKSAYDAENLYVAFDVADDLLKTKFEKNDDHLWEEDCVEIMVDPDGDGKNYFELQVSPANKSFDTRYETRRHPRPFGHMDWNSGLVSGVQLRGKLNDADKDEGYTAEIAIPWTAFAAGEPKHEAPKAGDTWRVNFYVMDKRENGMRAVGWSPPRVGDFHVPRRFGKLTFAAPKEAVKAEAEPKAEEKPKAAKGGAKAPAEKKGATAQAER
jgi:hypothetical protein